jgi:hypothetical protein
MTATPTELATHEQASLHAVNFAIIELLIQPEYGQDFIDECVREFQPDTNMFINGEAIGTRVDAKLREMARPLIEQLPAEFQERYEKYL